MASDVDASWYWLREIARELAKGPDTLSVLGSIVLPAFVGASTLVVAIVAVVLSAKATSLNRSIHEEGMAERARDKRLMFGADIRDWFHEAIWWAAVGGSPMATKTDEKREELNVHRERVGEPFARDLDAWVSTKVRNTEQRVRRGESVDPNDILGEMREVDVRVDNWVNNPHAFLRTVTRDALEMSLIAAIREKYGDVATAPGQAK
jgi:hypothetical protein